MDIFAPHGGSLVIRLGGGLHEPPLTLRHARRIPQPPANRARCPILFIYRVIGRIYRFSAARPPSVIARALLLGEPDGRDEAELKQKRADRCDT